MIPLFYNLYSFLLQNPSQKFQNKQKIYSYAESGTSNSNDPFFIADVFFKLYLLYPDDFDSNFSAIKVFDASTNPSLATITMTYDDNNTPKRILITVYNIANIYYINF